MQIPSKPRQKKQDPIEYGKVPPQAIDLEVAVLGAAMLETEGTEAIIRLLLTESFYKDQHQIIFEAIQDLYRENQTVDMLTVTERLRAKGSLETIGGPLTIANLTANIVSSANIEAHCAIIQQKYFQRKLIMLGSEIVRDAYEDTTDAFDLMDFADHGLQKIREIVSTGSEAKHIEVLLKLSRESLRHREEMVKMGKMTGVPTGITDLNIKTNGWQSSNLIIWASRPGMGKTAVMLKEAKEAAKAGVPVCIYSLEMEGLKLSDRLVLSECGIDADKYRSGWMTSDDWLEFDKAEAALKSLPIYVDDNPVVSMRYIKSHARMMQRKGRCGMIMIDYLQLADMKLEQNGRNREQEVAQASRDAKIIAKTLSVPLHLLAQLSRAVEKRGGDMRPMLSDLRESGAIEQDADVVIFIHRPEYYGILEDGDGNSTKGVGELIIAKNRDGALGIVPFKYNPSLTKIWDYCPDLKPGTIPPNQLFDEQYKMDMEDAPF